MSAGWENLPLLPLRCIASYLSVDNAMAAMSTCRHWRNTLLLYEGHRELLVLKASELDRNLFLCRMFKKHVHKLHVYIDCAEGELVKFMNYVLPQFFDSIKLNEVVFIGPTYMHLNPMTQFVKLNRIITESLVFKHSNFIQKLAFIGCQTTTFKNEKDKYMHKQVEYFSKPLTFNSIVSPADSVISRCNVDMMMFSTLKHIIIEYEMINTESLETLSMLENFTLLTLNVIFKRELILGAIDWERVNPRFTKGLDVAVNLISLPHRKFKAVIDNVLVQDMNLTSVKVLFCKTVSKSLLSHLCRLFQHSVREVVWVDSPLDAAEGNRVIRMRSGHVRTYLSDAYHQVNPFILLCWQCLNLKRLVIHGYWIWQYDIVGFLRLRRPLSVEVSAVYARAERFPPRAPALHDCALRVLASDHTDTLDYRHVQEVNQFTDANWKPIPWHDIHAGLRNHSTPELRADYIVKEVLHPLGVT